MIKVITMKNSQKSAWLKLHNFGRWWNRQEAFGVTRSDPRSHSLVPLASLLQRVNREWRWSHDIIEGQWLGGLRLAEVSEGGGDNGGRNPGVAERRGVGSVGGVRGVGGRGIAVGVGAVGVGWIVGVSVATVAEGQQLSFIPFVFRSGRSTGSENGDCAGAQQQ